MQSSTYQEAPFSPFVIRQGRIIIIIMIIIESLSEWRAAETTVVSVLFNSGLQLILLCSKQISVWNFFPLLLDMEKGGGEYNKH